VATAKPDAVYWLEVCQLLLVQLVLLVVQTNMYCTAMPELSFATVAFMLILELLTAAGFTDQVMGLGVGAMASAGAAAVVAVAVFE
jgi:hypothetical protein